MTLPPGEPTGSESADPTGSPDPPERWLTPGILGVGGASLCSDAGHELVTSLLPTFVTSTLHAGPAALGAIDGVADALTGLSKLAGGPLAADPSRRGRLAAGGYLGTAVATAAIGIATAVWQVAVLRALAWVSRGLRSPARDTLLTDLSRRGAFGRAFGVERAGDNLGAIIGPLLAAVLVGTLGIRHTILLSIVPGMLAAVAITVAAREARRTLAEPAGRRRLSLSLGALQRAGVTRALVPLACFELGNLATTLLILRASDLLAARPGWSPSRAASVAVLLYAAHNAVAALAALVAGALADRRGPRLVLVTAGVCYVAGYALLAAGPRGAGLVVAFLLAGCGIGLGETASSTVVALATPEPLRGNAFGVLGLTQAVGDLGATVVAGALWAWLGPGVAFGYAGAWMVLAILTSGRAGVARATPHPA